MVRERRRRLEAGIDCTDAHGQDIYTRPCYRGGSVVEMAARSQSVCIHYTHFRSPLSTKDQPICGVIAKSLDKIWSQNRQIHRGERMLMPSYPG